MISTKKEKLIIIILVVLNVLVYSGNCYLYFLNNPKPEIKNETFSKKPKENIYINTY